MKEKHRTMWTENKLFQLFESYRREILYIYEFSSLLGQLEHNLPAKHIDAFRTSPHFFLCIRRSLTTSCCLWIRKLFLDKKDERTLYSLLNVIEQNINQYSAKNVQNRASWLSDDDFNKFFQELTQQEIKNDRENLQKISHSLKPVTDIADMYHAHNDKRFFNTLNGVGSVGADVLLFEKGYRFAADLVKKYWQKWDLTDRWHINPYITDVENILDGFTKFNQSMKNRKAHV